MSKIASAVTLAMLCCWISTSNASGDDGHGAGDGGHKGKEAGGLKLKHGLGSEHSGHASGNHASPESGRATGQRFGGGSGIAGSEQLVEGPEKSAGFGPEYRSQFRYRGGWDLPQDPGEDPSIPQDPGFNTGGSGGTGTAFHIVSEQRCEDMAAINSSNRLQGKNLERFKSSLSLLAPGTALTGSSALLLASYQKELEKQRPSPVLAGTYLGMVAKVPVTPPLITKVSSGLCVIPPGEKQSRIADIAEEQRRTLFTNSSR
ncbi:MAG: hypothetical protein HKL98_07655 [Burkholderiales bacterium]|nr:hypothetical protein [Burkholderiales bacterium]